MIANSNPNGQGPVNVVNTPQRPILSNNHYKSLVGVILVVIAVLIAAIIVILIILRSSSTQTLAPLSSDNSKSLGKATQSVFATTIMATGAPSATPVATPLFTALDTSSWKIITVGTTTVSLKIPATWTQPDDAAQYASFKSPDLEAPYNTKCDGNYSFNYHIGISAIFKNNLADNFTITPDSSKDISFLINGQQVKFSYFSNSLTGSYTNKPGFSLTQKPYIYAAILNGYMIEHTGNTGTVTKSSTGAFDYTCEPPEKDWNTAVNILSTVNIK